MVQDSDVSVFIINSGGEYVDADEFRQGDDGDGVFVCLTNDMLNDEYGDDDSICIHREWKTAVFAAYRSPFFKTLQNKSVWVLGNFVASIWQDGHFLLRDNAAHRYEDPDFWDQELLHGTLRRKYSHGWKTCSDIISSMCNSGSSAEVYIPAIMLAYHTCVEFGGHTLHGYLPAIGQLCYVDRNIGVVNDAIEKIGGDTVTACV